MTWSVSLAAPQGSPTGTLVLPNISTDDSIFQLEGWNGSAWVLVDADEYRVQPHTFKVIKRTAGVPADWTAYTANSTTNSTHRATYYVATPTGLFRVLNEPLNFGDDGQSFIAVDTDGAVNAEMAINLLVQELITSRGALRITADGLRTANVWLSDTLHLGGGTVTAYPQSVVNDDSVGDGPWTNPSNAILEDSIYAQSLIVVGADTQILVATDFGFRIPEDATLTGILVQIKMGHETIESETINVQLVRNGNLSGEVKTASFGSDLSIQFIDFGTTTDLWGYDWVAAEINQSNFGVSVQGVDAILGGSYIDVDSIRISVTYTTAVDTTVLNLHGNNAVGFNDLQVLGDLTLSGSLRETYQLVDGNTTLTQGDTMVACDTSGGAFTLILDFAPVKPVFIYKTTTDTNAVTIDPTWTIDGTTSFVLSKPRGSVLLIPGDSEWQTFEKPMTSTLIHGNGQGNSVAANTTAYFCSGYAVPQATESLMRIPVGFKGVARNLKLRTSSAQPGTGTLVFTIQKNGADTAITFTISAGAAAGLFGDTTHMFTFAAGDEVSIKVVNNASGTSAAIQGWSFELEQY